MNRSCFVVAVLLGCGTDPAVPISIDPDSEQRTYAFVNGKWFEGSGFVQAEFYSSDGILSSEPPAEIDSVIDLEGGYVVPPFGEAHQHNVDVDNPNFEAVVSAYLTAGIFYVKNPNTLPRTLDRTLAAVNGPATIDAAFSGGGVTGTDGHPKGVAQRNVDRGFWTAADLDGGFIYEIDDTAELEQRWTEIAADAPHFVKTYLLFSEEYAVRVEDSDYLYWKGMDPALLPRLVELAHADGLRVSTHVESAQDFRNAVAAGVDEINHLPGFRRGGPAPDGGFDAAFRLTAEDANAAAAAGVTVVTTVGGRVSNATVASNIRLLQDAGVGIAVGTDSYEAHARSEIDRLHSRDLFSNLELLRMWAITTPRTIFPDRAIGSLETGFEASFLVLAGNPLEDFEHTRAVTLGVKRGRIILR